jgi:carboxymethylenebutenolidase
MGETVEFKSNGNNASGYLATPKEGAGPGIIVIQEWWGLNDQIRRVCDRLATEGFSALAPDLYHGELAGHAEMDKANELMEKLPQDRAARDMSGAVDFLAGHDEVRGDGIGVVGYCMGGMLSLVLACQRSDKVVAVVSYYGAPLGDDQPPWPQLNAAVQAHVAEDDQFFPPDKMKDLFDHLNSLGKDVEIHTYPGAGHAFANEEDALGTHDEAAARQAWVRTLEFLRAKLG